MNPNMTDVHGPSPNLKEQEGVDSGVRSSEISHTRTEEKASKTSSGVNVHDDVMKAGPSSSTDKPASPVKDVETKEGEQTGKRKYARREPTPLKDIDWSSKVQEMKKEITKTSKGLTRNKRTGLALADLWQLVQALALVTLSGFTNLIATLSASVPIFRDRIFWQVEEVGSNLSGVVRPLVQDVEHAAENTVDMVAHQYLPNMKRSVVETVEKVRSSFPTVYLPMIKPSALGSASQESESGTTIKSRVDYGSEGVETEEHTPGGTRKVPRLYRTDDEVHREEGSLMGKVSHLAL
jgi:hypothetical protein